jgi:signal transduction histidine kinase
LPQARVTVAGQVIRGMRYATTRADGSLVLLRVTGAPRRSSSGLITRILLVLEDISREAVMESHLARTQQIQAAGILASGLVHDFINDLTVIKGSAELLRDTPANAPERAERLGTIAGAADRCASLAQRLLKYCRRQKPEVEALDVNQVVCNLAKPLARVLGGHIALTVTPAATESCIAADPVMLEGAILNLAINARDAMADGGRLKIETRTVCGGDDGAAGRTDAPDRPYVMLIVSDTGKGMDLPTQQRAFDPFFTTKAEGTGLGLAMVRNFVRETGGFVSVKSEPGKGTTFRICLPCLSALVAPAKVAVTVPA